MNEKKYVITQWVDEFDYDGMTCSFSILGEFYDLVEARAYLAESVNRLTLEQLSQRAAEPGRRWHLMSIRGKKRPQYYRVNQNNKVVGHGSFKIGDGTGFYSLYNYLELIELPKAAAVDENLFDLRDCGFEVRQYFNEQRKK
jgi:hypothetical protein